MIERSIVLTSDQIKAIFSVDDRALSIIAERMPADRRGDGKYAVNPDELMQWANDRIGIKIKKSRWQQLGISYRWSERPDDPATRDQHRRLMQRVTELEQEVAALHDFKARIEEMIEAGQIRVMVRRNLPHSTRTAVILRDQSRCRYCNKHVVGLDRTIDHVVPITRGGTNSELNLVVACRPCNNRKRDMTPDEAGMPLLPLPPRLAV